VILLDEKGQLTVFIIIGLAILLLIGILIYYSTREQGPVSELPAISIVPSEVVEVSDLLSACVKDLTITGLIHVGQSGGYLNTRELNSNPVNPTDGDSLEFFPNNKIAYWSFMNSKNDCVSCSFSDKIPSLDKIRTDLENYVLANFNTCKDQLNSLSDWRVKETGSPSVKIVFTDAEVGAYLTYPIRVSKGSVQKDLREFMSPIKLRFTDIYNNAFRIARSASNNGFLGEYVKHLIYSYSGLEEDMLPPIRELTNEFGPGKFWSKFEVEDRIKNDLLTNNIPLLQIPGTASTEVFQEPAGSDPNTFYSVFTRSFNLPIDNINSDYDVNFFYLPSWNIYLSMDCPSGICKAESVLLQNIIPLGIQDYSTVYDVSYPVAVFINDPYAFNGLGYTFKIALEGNMRNNKALIGNVQLSSSDYKENVASSFCDPNKKTSGLTTFIVKDESNGWSVDDAIISFSHIEDCSMGVTKNGVFKSKFPRAIGGVVSVFKEGYDTEFINLDPDENEQNVNVFLKPLKTLNVKTAHFPIVKEINGWELRKGAEFPDQDETVYVIIKKDDFVRAVTLDKNNGFYSKIDLAPGKYNVSIHSVLSPKLPLIIPSKPYTFRTMPTQSKTVNIPEKDIVFNEEDKLFSGNSELEWTLNENDLYTNNEVKFYYFYQDLKNVPESERTVSDFEVLGDLENYNKAFTSLLLPELS